MTTMTAPAIAEDMALVNPEHFAALGHEIRQLAMLHLIERPYTNKQLATVLGESPARMHFHVQELLKAGLIALVETRPKRGVIEKYYRAVARRYRTELTADGVGVPS